jgi:hypothetical protein
MSLKASVTISTTSSMMQENDLLGMLFMQLRVMKTVLDLPLQRPIMHLMLLALAVAAGTILSHR